MPHASPHPSRHPQGRRLRRVRLLGVLASLALAAGLTGALGSPAAAADTTAPAAPVDTTASYDSAALTAKITWVRGDGKKVAGYRVYRRPQGQGPDSYTAVSSTESPASTTYSDKPPATGGTYSYAVRAVDKTGQESAYSTAADVTTVDQLAPDGPMWISASSGSEANSLAWNEVSDAARCEVYRASEETGETGAFTRIATVESTSYADTGAWADVPYAYKVRAVDAAGNLSDFSDLARATRDTTAPLSPQDLTVAKQDEQGITLTWRNGGSDAVKYNVYRGTSPSSAPNVKVGSTNTLTYRDTSGDAGLGYFYLVRGVDGTGNESAGTAPVLATKQVGPTTVPASPNLNVAYVAGDKLTLKWLQSPYVPISQYRVYRSRTTPVDTTSPANEFAVTSETSLSRTVADDEKDYYYAVVAESGYGVLSTPSASRLPELRPPQLPPATSFWNVQAGDGRATLNWYAVGFSTDEPPFAGYRLYRSTTPGVTPGNAEAVFAPTSDGYVDTGLTNGTTYYYVVTVLNTDGVESNLSPEVSVTPTA
ncbi:hypothetical protein EOT10_09690 [Streptomyces antnestii]|uniref:Fibronectin type-III domain-containing protein n=1 Tax=Streptomyces antnestii TaxID=2494256 RepID=A0A3S2VJT5_9ACTN|nr:hypothetical protein [Streptomyces sp. San01]RVU27425.1 hypothetical protein EOT10_09690 [Streptomyces sp. San01]